MWALVAVGLGLAQPFKVTDATGKEVEVRSTERIVSLGGSITEVLYKLGLGSRVVARDTTSYIPLEAMKKPDLGLLFRLNAEPILALKPTLILATADAGPPPVIAQLRQAGVTIVLVPDEASPEGVKKKLRIIAAAVGQVARGEELVRGLERDLLALKSQLSQASKQPTKRVLYLYPRDPRNTFICGDEASGAGLLTLAGAENAAKSVRGTGALRGCVNITAEAVVAARPEVIVAPFFPDQPLTLENLLQLPGVAQTPAGQNKRLVAVEVLYLSGYGYTVAQAALDLHRAIYDQTGFVQIYGALTPPKR